MRIVLATPLYPPDIAAPAPYIKELAQRLAGNEVSVLAYGRLPEEVPGVRIRTVSKQQPLLIRLAAYTFALWGEARHADIIHAENGASVELPIALVSLLCSARIIFHMGDAAAHAHAARGGLYGSIERLSMKRAQVVITEAPLLRPEILPFVPYPAEAFERYEQSWKDHLAELHAAYA